MASITISVKGDLGSGKTTIIREIRLALEKAGLMFGDPTDFDYGKLDVDDTLQGKKLDCLAKRIKDGDLRIYTEEILVNRANDDFDTDTLAVPYTRP